MRSEAVYKGGPHDSALQHVTGRARYICDEPARADEVWVAAWYAPVAKGRIRAMELSDVAKMEGVAGVFTAKDLASNTWGPITADQPFLADTEVSYLGEPVVLLALEDRDLAATALEAIKVDIEASDPTLSIGEARAKGRFIGEPQRLQRGDVDTALNVAPHRFQGTFRCLGQDHFYLELHAAIAYPIEGRGLDILSSTQHPSEVQHLAAQALALPHAEVSCRVVRLGGGFGGKESQASHVAVLAALVAHHLQRPARIELSKDDDMVMTGKRHPYENEYDVGFDDQGRILGLRAALYSDGGAFADLSGPVLQRSLFHLDNAYFIPQLEFDARICRTNTAPNTAFRGFGGPQGVATIETIIEEIATHLSLDPWEVRRANLYDGAERNTTPYGQEVEEPHLARCLTRVLETSDYLARRASIEAHNRASPTLLKGISLTPVKFGISFTARFLNQGNALVHVMTDGSIQVSTGAVEMGQGVNTKIRNLVAECFGLPIDRVRLLPTSTEKNHNTSATAASSGSDINGAAAVQASEVIKERLAGLAAAMWSSNAPEGGNELRPTPDPERGALRFEDGSVRGEGGGEIDFAALCSIAYRNRIDLGARGFYRTRGLHFDPKTGTGHPFLYFTNGAAVSEVSVDRYTGETKVLRVDIVMDLGRRINAGVDYGQTVGGFVQGMGWVTTEKLHYDDKGFLATHSPTTYKIPNIQDTPRDLRVEFLEDADNPRNVRGSKAVGEPPFMLATSVWTAIRNAVSSSPGAKAETLPLPATQEAVLRALEPLSFAEPNDEK